MQTNNRRDLQKLDDVKCFGDSHASSGKKLCNVVASHVAYMFGDIYEEFRLIEEVKYKASCDSIESNSSNQINGAAWSFINRGKKLNRIYSIRVSLTTREVNVLIALSINMLIAHTQSYSVSRENPLLLLQLFNNENGNLIRKNWRETPHMGC